MILIRVLTITRVLHLWLHARIRGVSISFRDALAIHLRGGSVADIVRVVTEAHQAGLSLSCAEVDQALQDGIDCNAIVLAMIEAKRNGTELTFQELLTTCQTRSNTRPKGAI